jgi:NADH dehydrogenase/NADH:ubiquinone oxidoreductase subunit G
MGKPANIEPGDRGYPGAMSEFRKGDRVAWSSHGGEAVGEVLKKITEDTEEAGRTVRASPDEPQYLVRSEKSGGEAVHKASALRKR